MATNRFNTVITQVKGATLQVEFSGHLSGRTPFQVTIPLGWMLPSGEVVKAPRTKCFTCQTKAREYVRACDPAVYVCVRQALAMVVR